MGAFARLAGLQDPRGFSLFALGLVVLAAALAAGRPAPWVVSVALLLPLALGAVFGARSLWTAGGLALVVVLAGQGRAVAAALAFGATVALDHGALAAAPLLALAFGAKAGRPVTRLMAWAALGYSVLVVPVALLDPRAFFSAFAPRFEAGPGFGVVNILLYGGSVPASVAVLLSAGASLVAVLGVVALRRTTPASAIPLAACLSLAALWLNPAPAVGALAVPLVLVVLAAPGLAADAEPQSP